MLRGGATSSGKNPSRERLNGSHSAPSSSQGLEELYGESPFDDRDDVDNVERQARLALKLGSKDAFDDHPVFSEDESTVSAVSQDPKPFLAGKKLEAIVDTAPPFYNAEVGTRSTLFAFNRNKHFCEPLVTFGTLAFIVEYLTTEAGKKYLLAFLCYYHDVATADDIISALHGIADNSNPNPNRIVVPTKKDLRCVYREIPGFINAQTPKKGSVGVDVDVDANAIRVACPESRQPEEKLDGEDEGVHGDDQQSGRRRDNAAVKVGKDGDPTIGGMKKEGGEASSCTVKVVNAVSFFSALYGRIGFPTERDHRGVAEVLRVFVRDFNALEEVSPEGLVKLHELCDMLGPFAKDVVSLIKNAKNNHVGRKRLAEKKRSSHFAETSKSSGETSGTRTQRMRAKFKIGIRELYRTLRCDLGKFLLAEKREMGRRYSAFKQQVFEHRAKSLGEFYKYTEKQVAMQLTNDLYEVYARIGPKEMLTLDARQNSENVHKMIDLFNRYSWWCVNWVLTGMIDSPKDDEPEDVNDRVNRLLYMMKVAEECRQLNSFHAFFGLMGGLCQPQLMWVWGFAKEKDKMMFNNLKRAVSPHNDYRVYRADLSKCTDDTYIPFLGYTTKVLFTFEKQIKAFSTEFPDLIDFGRLISMFATVEEFLDGKESSLKNSNLGMFWGVKNDSPKAPTRKAARRLAKLLQKQLNDCKSSEQLDEISQKQQDTMRTVLLDSLKTSGFL